VSRREKISEVLRSVSRNSGTPAALSALIGSLDWSFGVQAPGRGLTPRKFDTIEKIGAHLESRGA
jgi:hypothetical protein